MQLEATGTTHKTTLGTAIVPSSVMTLRACLRGMPGVHPRHRQSAFFCLVREEKKELGKGPTMHTALCSCLALRPHALADVCKIFEHQRAARVGTHDELFGQNMVAVTSEAGLPALEVSQVTFGTFTATGLQPAFEPKVAALCGFPSFLPQEPVGGDDGGMCQAQINPNHLVCVGHSGRCQGDHDMQPPFAVLTLHQVGSIDRQIDVLGSIVRHSERHRHAPSYRRETHGTLLPGQRIGMHVVSGRAGGRLRTRHLKSSLLSGKSRLQCFRRFDASLNDQIGHQSRARSFLTVVRRVVQPHTVLFSLCPPIGTDIIKRSRELLRCLSECLALFRCWVELKANSSLHTMIIPYAMRFCIFLSEKGQGETTVLLAQDVHSSAS